MSRLETPLTHAGAESLNNNNDFTLGESLGEHTVSHYRSQLAAHKKIVYEQTEPYLIKNFGTVTIVGVDTSSTQQAEKFTPPMVQSAVPALV